MKVQMNIVVMVAKVAIDSGAVRTEMIYISSQSQDNCSVVV